MFVILLASVLSIRTYRNIHVIIYSLCCTDFDIRICFFCRTKHHLFM